MADFLVKQHLPYLLQNQFVYQPGLPPYVNSLQNLELKINEVKLYDGSEAVFSCKGNLDFLSKEQIGRLVKEKWAGVTFVDCSLE